MDGKILVVGGVRRSAPTDVPPSKLNGPEDEEAKPSIAPGEMLPPF
jgi:hypothetical protein